VLGGQVPVLFAVPGTAIPHINAGKFRAIGITGETRFKSLPSVPTFAEQGVPGVDGTIIIGFAAPAKTPRAIVTQLHDTLTKVLRDERSRRQAQRLRIDGGCADPERSAKLLADETALWAKVVKNAGVKLE
jgi:tripartite-type tricarboxylate transporter receptor subunit TctC